MPMSAPCQVAVGMLIGISFFVGAAVMAVITVLPLLWRQE